MSAKRKKLSKVVKSKLSDKLSKVRADDPKLTFSQALGKAIGILQQEEKKT